MGRGPNPDLALHPDRAIHKADKPLDNGESQTGTSVFSCIRPIYLSEGVKDCFQLVPGDADAGIRNRKKQIDLIGRLGLELNELVHHRLVLWLIRTLRAPARAAGFGLLQSFLENGLNAFRIMGDGTEFVETLWHEEAKVMDRLFDADKNPFM